MSSRKFAFEAVSGVFAQSLPETDWLTFDYAAHDMGLIVQDASRAEAVENAMPEKPWHRMMKYIAHLQETAAPGVQYKLIINGRHGEGHHNVAERKFGTKAWDDYWSKLDGTDGVTWSDSLLTSVGEQQAIDAGVFLADQIKTGGLPPPQSYIVSPLYRCLQTAFLTWSRMPLPADRPFKPVIKEMIREVMGEHTCDRRQPLSIIRRDFPGLRFEHGIVEEDVLWRADHRETDAEHDLRTQTLLDDIFEHDPKSVVISFTSHSGSIASLLRVLGHRAFKLQTGAMIPLLVKATPLGSSSTTRLS